MNRVDVVMTRSRADVRFWKGYRPPTANRREMRAGPKHEPRISAATKPMRDAHARHTTRAVADGSETPSGKIGPIGISHQSIAAGNELAIWSAPVACSTI